MNKFIFFLSISLLFSLALSAGKDKKKRTGGTAAAVAAQIAAEVEAMPAEHEIFRHIRDGEQDNVQNVFEAPFDFTITDERDDTPLHAAVRVGNYDMVAAVYYAMLGADDEEGTVEEAVMRTMNEDTFTPLRLAQEFLPAGHGEYGAIVDLLTPVTAEETAAAEEAAQRAAEAAEAKAAEEARVLENRMAVEVARRTGAARDATRPITFGYFGSGRSGLPG